MLMENSHNLLSYFSCFLIYSIYIRNTFETCYLTKMLQRKIRRTFCLIFSNNSVDWRLKQYDVSWIMSNAYCLSRLFINDLSSWPPRIVSIGFTGFLLVAAEIVRFNSVYAMRLIGLASDLGLDAFTQLTTLNILAFIDTNARRKSSLIPNNSSSSVCFYSKRNNACFTEK